MSAAASMKKMQIHSPIPEKLVGELNKAADILEHFIKGNNQMDATMIPEKIISKAKGIAVITMLKAGFLWSGRAGTGLVVARLPDGRWSAPSAIAAAGAGFGAQIGCQLTDCVFILNNDSAVKAFSHGGNITLGGNMSVAAGPKGRSAEAAGAVVDFAPIYSYSKSKGLFAGISLEGSVIITRHDANKELYCQKVTPQELLNGSIPPPVEAEPLYRILNYRFSNMGTGITIPVPFHKKQLDRAASRTLSSSKFSLSKSRVGVMGSGTVAPSKDVKADMSGVKGSTGSVNKKPVPPVPAPHKPGATPAVAMFDYRGERSTDLSFKKGDKIDVVKYGAPTEWWTGSLNGGPVGEFPGNYVRLSE